MAPHLSQGSSFSGPQPLVPKMGERVAARPGGCREIGGEHPQSPDGPLCMGADSCCGHFTDWKAIWDPALCPLPAPQPPALGFPGGSTKHELSRIICSSSKDTGSGRDHLLGSSNVFSYLAVERCPARNLAEKPRFEGAFTSTAPPHFMLYNSAPQSSKPHRSKVSPFLRPTRKLRPRNRRVTVVCRLRGGRSPARMLRAPGSPRGPTRHLLVSKQEFLSDPQPGGDCSTGK